MELRQQIERRRLRRIHVLDHESARTRVAKGAHLQQRLISGMLANGYRREFAEQIYRQILGFGEYGFPESHAASFALLAYVSAWLKCHEPAAFVAALLNSHYITGDGRGNENIGLTSVHQIFHGEHNTVVSDIKSLLSTSP